MSSKALKFRDMFAVQILGNYLLCLICRRWDEPHLLMVGGGAVTTGTLHCPYGQSAGSAPWVLTWTSCRLDATEGQTCRQALTQRAVARPGTSGPSLLDVATSLPSRLSSTALLSQTDADETKEFRVLGSCKALWDVFNFGC